MGQTVRALITDLVAGSGRQAARWLGRRRNPGLPATAGPLLVLCDALLSPQGEASGALLAGQVLARYGRLADAEKAQFLSALVQRYGPDRDVLDAAISAYQAAGDGKSMARLHAASEPRRQQLIRRLNLAVGGTGALVDMREDLLRLKGQVADYQDLDIDFNHLFGSWFNAGFLDLQEITWTSPADILRKLISYEAVHAIVDWEDLRRRLEPADRRCFAYFHPSLPGEPLIFVEVALTAAIPDSIQDLLAETRTPMQATAATTAVFYSISTCQDGLRGVPFGNFLIKRVVEQLKAELPHLRTFVTLSPAPGFAAWLAAERQADEAQLSAAEKEILVALDAADRDERLRHDQKLRRCLSAVAARYYLNGKTRDGRVVDPVARFHLGNGARLEQINLLADTSPKGHRESHGVMVNYLYDLNRLTENYSAFSRGEVAAAPSVQRLARRPSPSPQAVTGPAGDAAPAA